MTGYQGEGDDATSRGDRPLSDADYRRLADLRHGQRRFLHWSAAQAAGVGLTSTQHQLLLGVRAWPEPKGPTIGDIAAFLLIRHHSAVELVDRAEAAGLVTRRRDSVQAAQVRVTLTAQGVATLDELTGIHLRELAELAPTMGELWSAIAEIAHAERVESRL